MSVISLIAVLGFTSLLFLMSLVMAVALYKVAEGS